MKVLTQRREVAKGNEMMTENEVAREVVDCAFKVHTQLGPGLLESVYELILAAEIKRRGLDVVRQVPVPIVYEGVSYEEAFRIDLMVEDKLVIELKSVEQVNTVHKKQLLTYLRLTDKRLGLLINFGDVLIRNGISRIVNNLKE